MDGCRGSFCSLHKVMLWMLQRLAGNRRKVVPAYEAPGEEYVPGVLRVMREGFSYPEHFDSLHAHAWPFLRAAACGVGKDQLLDRTIAKGSIGVHQFSPLRRHAFSTSVILTLQEPLRTTLDGGKVVVNPDDLVIYRTRWPSLLANCSVHAKTSGLLGRFEALPAAGNLPEAGFRRPKIHCT